MFFIYSLFVPTNSCNPYDASSFAVVKNLPLHENILFSRKSQINQKIYTSQKRLTGKLISK